MYGSITLAFVMWMLRKTKFYQTPYQLSNTKTYDPNTSFFYDPFIVFATLLVLNVSFSILNNSKYIFRRSFFTNLGFFFYISLLSLITFNILFVYQLYHGSTQLFWVNLFRIPDVFGFEYLVVLFIFVFIICFYLVRYAEKTWVRNYIKNFGKREKKRRYKVDTESVSESLYTESKATSVVEKKSRNSKSSSRRNIKKKLP